MMAQAFGFFSPTDVKGSFLILLENVAENEILSCILDNKAVLSGLDDTIMQETGEKKI